MKILLLSFCWFLFWALATATAKEQPNVLFIFADDWGRVANLYSKIDGPGTFNDVVRTPNIDSVGRQGVVFTHAFVNAPSCTPCRSSLLSGQHFWRTGRAAILQGAVWNTSIPTFPLQMLESGYTLGKHNKVWSPGKPADAPFGNQKYAYEAAGKAFNSFSHNASKKAKQGSSIDAAKKELFEEVRSNFQQFLSKRDQQKPFLFWFGPTNVHRRWLAGSGRELWNLNPDDLRGKLPGFMPDVPEVREDFNDYLGEVQALDTAVGVLLEELRTNALDKNTIIVVSGDHGPPGFPHGKCNLYDFGTRVSLMISGPRIQSGRIIDDLVTLPDLAPTLLDAAGVMIPSNMTARSLWPILTSDRSGLVDPSRDCVFTGRERHVAEARLGHKPYPQRAIRTRQFSLIVNFEPDRYPLGDPFRLDDGASEPTVDELSAITRATIADCDAGPTKAWLVQNRKDPRYARFYKLSFGKRPRIELFDLEKDPHQLRNVADVAEYHDVVMQLETRLMDELRITGDPRVIENGSFFEEPPMSGPVKD
jgi:arylsulfatase A-like enzyme